MVEVEGGVGAGSAVLQSFTESAEVLDLLGKLPLAVSELRTREIAEQKFTMIIGKYQEQPHLLDAHLGTIVSKLLTMAKQTSLTALSQQAFRYLYLLSKVRGPKVILRWFSHEVADLEPVLSLLESQDSTCYQMWESRYILLLWLSVIIMIPFDLSLLDSCQEGQHQTLHRILTLGQHYMLLTDKSRDAAALLLSRLLTRPDVQALVVSKFLEWCGGQLILADMSSMQGMAAACGVLATLASLFKLSKRESVVDYAPSVLQSLKACNSLSSGNALLRKLSIKLTQRLGTTFLPMRVASWRYQRGRRSLEDTLSALSSQQNRDLESSDTNDLEDDNFDVSEELEEVLEVLLCGLRDCDSVVRWSAAKGVGRVTSRLPRSLADDVLQSLLGYFSVREGDTAWHGGCLAVAELGRRGLLLPTRLADVVPVLLQALNYDEKRGTYSVGAHVRDAACYVCWAFARAYDPQQLQIYVPKIACGLLVTALFDREVNCRRAAAAAFQENVGRQGTFPHGIDVLTSVDYFTVGSRVNAFVNLSAHVAQYQEYTQPLIDHLIHSKLGHWDSSLRELAAKALNSLTPHSPTYMQEIALPYLLSLVVTTDPRLRHGALCAVGEVTSSLYSLHSQSFPAGLGEKLVLQLVDVVPQLEFHGVFKGAAGECMRPAALNFIVKMCNCMLSVSGQPALASWQRVIDANLPHTEERIREVAVDALQAVSSTHYSMSSDDCPDNLVDNYLTGLNNPSQFTRMGYCLALGALPRPLLLIHLKSVLEGLVSVVSNIEGCEPRYAESRRDAARAISRMCKTVGVGEDGLTQENIDTIFSALVAALNDYTTDARGDIGAVVREAAMTALEEVCTFLARSNPSMAAPHMQQVICLLLQQANEKIDRTRALACRKLQEILQYQPSLLGIPHHSYLASLFDTSQLGAVNWSMAATTFPITVQLLALPEYSYHTLLGVTASCGGLSESTVRASSAALLSYLKEPSTSVKGLELFSEALLDIFRRNTRDTRVTLPLLMTLDQLLSNAVFDAYLHHPQHSFPLTLLSLVKQEITNCTDTKKLLASINVLCGLLQFPAIRRRTLNRLMLLLCHRFPRIRRGTGDQLYATIILYDDIIPADVVEEVTAALADTLWEGDIEDARKKRDCLCDLLNLARPVVKSPAIDKQHPASDEMASYRDLVDRVGY